MSYSTSDQNLRAYRANLDGAAISTYALAMIAVPLKLWCRAKSTGVRQIGLEEAFCVLSLLFANAFFYLSMIGLRPALGKHTGTQISPRELSMFLKVLVAASADYIMAISFIKYTILAMYWKLFSITARVPILILAFTVAAWNVALLCLAIFPCRPIQAQWDISVTDYKCVPSRAVYLGGSLPNVIIDFILVAMPMPYVLKLKIHVGQRLILVGIFALGCFVGIVSIIRLTVVLSIPKGSDDTTYNTRIFIMWSIVEIHIGIVCSCLPSMRPLLRTIGLGRLFSSKSRTIEVTPGESAQRLSRKNNMGRPYNVFSRAIGMTKLESEDGFEMMSECWHGNSTADVERRTMDGDIVTGAASGMAGVTVQKEWEVSIESTRGLAA